MVTIERISNDPYMSKPGLVELEKIANQQKLLPEEYISPEGNFVTKAFVEYAMPLIGGSAVSFPRLQGKRVALKTI